MSGYAFEFVFKTLYLFNWFVWGRCSGITPGSALGNRGIIPGLGSKRAERGKKKMGEGTRHSREPGPSISPQTSCSLSLSLSSSLYLSWPPKYLEAAPFVPGEDGPRVPAQSQEQFVDHPQAGRPVPAPSSGALRPRVPPDRRAGDDLPPPAPGSPRQGRKARETRPGSRAAGPAHSAPLRPRSRGCHRRNGPCACALRSRASPPLIRTSGSAAG